MAEPGSVTCAYVCQNTVIYSWHKSMLELLAYDMANNGRLHKGGFIATRFGADGLGEARNKTAETFLQEDKAEWLWWVDTDMGFAPDTVDRLLEAADPVERPIVGGLCFFNREDEPDGLGGYRHTTVPTIYDWAHIDDQYGWQVRWKYPTNTLTQVGATGAACVLIHRSVFEKIQAAHGRVWYDRIPNVTTGQRIGEDMSFCLRAGALQIPIFVHTGVPTTHFKQVWLGEEDYWTQVALNTMRDTLADEKPEGVTAGLKRVAMTREQSWTFDLLPEALAELGVEPRSVLHVGAHRGEEVPIYQKCGFEQITLVEPDPINAAFLAEEFPDCYVVETAVGDKYGTTTLHRAVNTVFSGLKADAGQPTVDSVEVRIQPLNAVQGGQNVLVVDTQGTELEVLGTADLTGVDLVIVETQDVSRAMYAAFWPDAVEALGKVGFIPAIRWEHEQHFADTLFTRAPATDA